MGEEVTLSGTSWSGSGRASQEARVRDPRGWLGHRCCLRPAEDGLGSCWVLAAGVPRALLLLLLQRLGASSLCGCCLNAPR